MLHTTLFPRLSVAKVKVITHVHVNTFFSSYLFGVHFFHFCLIVAVIFVCAHEQKKIHEEKNEPFLYQHQYQIITNILHNVHHFVVECVARCRFFSCWILMNVIFEFISKGRERGEEKCSCY